MLSGEDDSGWLMPPSVSDGGASDTWHDDLVVRKHIAVAHKLLEVKGPARAVFRHSDVLCALSLIAVRCQLTGLGQRRWPSRCAAALALVPVVISMCAGQLEDMLARGRTVALMSRMHSGDCEAAVEGASVDVLVDGGGCCLDKGAVGATHGVRDVSCEELWNGRGE
ncbi:hypothetical protein POSPLADRAFT_1050920 [Postia placenta MAD-698-R-SB12]|uniref:Uncharacterized protein n=1 Tax=Postia placenta MAD-698-R-SB12 TaxID=670580 RepID=A0A1X6MI44_9APHY|nr:hypothetical protein POSPLADRAFT_1050920 [Postia placenta MAD-698-R-SB12]OSX56040.1 hypothetical protein POSPLADRAFT_1050920 [Postia placenta MAD-698-R-SB12]